MKFHCLPDELDLQYKGPNRIRCSARYNKGDEMGYFQHGSTIIVFATSDYALAEGIAQGQTIRMGQALMSHTHSTVAEPAPLPSEAAALAV
jgi:phosphatidylserine decarboxylase